METAPDMLKVFLRERDPKSWNEALGLADNYKEVHGHKYAETGRASFQRDCVRSERDHESKNCSGNQRETDKRADRKVPLPNRADDKRVEHRSKVTCYACGNTGHLANRCLFW